MSKPIEAKVEELFKHTQKELGMGGELVSTEVARADAILFIESEHRMDANMMQTLRKHLNAEIIFSNTLGNVLVMRLW